VGFSPDGKLALIGLSDGKMLVYDLIQQRQVGSFQAHDNGVEQISFSTKNPKRFLTRTKAGDGTVRLWELGKDQPIATLVNLDQSNWVVVGSNRLFDASPGAMQLLFYEVEESGNKEIVELEQLKARYYEPGLLQKLLGFSDERIRSVEGLNNITLYPTVSTKIENDQLTVNLQARSGGIGKVSLFANGKEIENDINPQRQTSITYNLRASHKFLVKTPGTQNTISLRLYNREGWLKSSAIDLPYQPTAWARGSGSSENTTTGSQDPSMYVVSIGTSNYNGDRLDLNYADQDATLMARAIEAAGSRLFAKQDKLEIYCLSTASQDSTGLENTKVQWRFANKQNIQAVLNGIKSKAKPEDIVVLYLSGHGLSYGSGANNQFYYLTHEIQSEDMLSSADTRQKYTVSSGELTEWMTAIPALKQVLVIDACNSGKVIEELTSNTRNLNSSQIRALDRMKDRTGMFVLSGSAADKVSYEASEFGQGLLTYAILQGMRGVATRQMADGNYVDVMKLFQYARDEVPRLAESISGIQTPMLVFPNQGASFDIGIVDGSVDIPIANKKPVIIRSKFLNQETLEDDLNLEGKLEAIFRKETERGKNADFIYVNVPKYTGAFKLSGLYTKAGNDITINIKLFEDGGTMQALEIPATNDLERLVKMIARAVKKALRR
ncbi:MAG: caspase family protein, partial [Bacteroidota bacterium]